ncbi:MAG: hypothetical protein LQ351_006345 [Letrouitia transgressa]|nr:MAG: hypothetical protein LQ351_006345 [Letrouitia transgressa]
MPSSSPHHSLWNRKSAFCVFVPQGVLALLIVALSAVTIGLYRAIIINFRNDSIDSLNYLTYDTGADYFDTGPSQYPYPFSGLCIAIATFLAFLISFVLVLKQKANPIGVMISNIFWATGWLGLFAYGIYLYHDYVPDIADAVDTIQFTFFILTPFEFIATLSIIVVAIQAHRRKVCAGGVGLAGPIYYPQASSVMPHHQPYPQYQQYPPSPSLVPAFELHNQSRPANELPGGPQPFYQNGQWYQYQPVPVSGQSLQPRLASPTTTTQLHYPQQFQQTATTQAAPTTELAANYTKSEMES